ncbi:hypothetical protein EJ02DRAFT_431722 [Clathrospora elynae]|uniref:Uncharacterized protein n=1 Tax=Clathrospora elynae TaxID=706981 RepID=A0A6A5T0C5_9PLEO|nr:hypothetical protein EJ02DRAFT_431722 [Clathrospora elynae]
MPPNGLYTIPRHHMGGKAQPLTRTMYSTLDFEDDAVEPAAVASDGAEPDDEKARRKNEKRDKKRERHSLGSQAKRELRKAKKKERRRSLEAQAADTPTVPPPKATPTGTPKSIRGPRDPYKKREKTSDDAETSLKKCKRENDVHAVAFTLLSGPRETPVPLPPQNVFTSSRLMETLAATTEPSGPPPKKRGRPPGKEPKGLEKAFTMIKTPVPVPSIASTLLSGPRKTQVPLPSQKMPAPLSQQPPKTARSSSQVLVAETPPSQMMPAATREPAIPFSLAKASTGRKTSKKATPTINISPATTVEDIQAPISAPAKLPKAAKIIGSSQTTLNSNWNVFTSSNLMSYKQPLNDAPKPRPRGRRATSVAASTTSSTSSGMSIPDMFNRVGKPYTRPGGQIDPFFSRKKKYVETHNEASLEDFTTSFRASQKSVNFADEMEYLDDYREWQIITDSAGTLPCLDIATGCTPKGEELLRLRRQDPSNVLRLLVTTEADATALADAKQRCDEAENLLARAVTMRIPVPLGCIEGLWKLFSPKYSDTHVDKLGFGQRSISINSIAGFKSGSTYTARLFLPPRSMAFTIRSFDVPPHASFRTTLMKTTVEGYRMEVMFMGNGYFKLRVDLQLLLKGKAMEGQHTCLEFIGVHEKAAVWKPEVDELEVEGRKLFAKYDGN